MSCNSVFDKGTDIMGTYLDPQRLGRSLLLVVAFGGALAGCSTLVGEKLGTTTDKQQVAPTGVPYSLVRPEYTISRAPPAEGAKKATYTLAVTYEPDPNQTYSVRLDPALFADPDFLIKLSTAGTVTGTTAKATEQISPTITAIGTFIASVAKVVLDTGTSREVVKNAMTEPIPKPDCDVATTLPKPPYESKSWTTVRDAISARIDGYANDAEFGALFEYLTPAEKTCLERARDYIETGAKGKLKTAADEWTKALAEFKGKQPQDSQYADSIAKFVAEGDEPGIKQQQEANTAQPDTPLRTDRDVLLSTALGAASAANKKGSPTLAGQLLQSFIDMDTTTWLARHIQYLEREIEQTLLYVLRNPDLRKAPSALGDAKSYVARMREERAETLGVADIYKRTQVLAEFLNSIREKSVERGTAPATTEFATARAELDALLAQIEVRRSRMLVDAKPPPTQPIEALTKVRTQMVTREQLATINDKGWDGPGEPPEFLIVLQEVK